MPTDIDINDIAVECHFRKVEYLQKR